MKIIDEGDLYPYQREMLRKVRELYGKTLMEAPRCAGKTSGLSTPRHKDDLYTKVTKDLNDDTE